tara:strand:- start:583 stop:1065 length:483 start_codon:yes stop_codon:yes gene_type:complete
MTIKVENNFLNNTHFWIMYKTFISENFPWYIENGHNDLVHNLTYESHLKKENSFYATKILDPIIVKLNIKNIVSSKITLNYSSSKLEKIAPPKENIDINNKSMRGFLCMNTNNSEIEIAGVSKIPLVENRFISFPKNNPYFASTHTDVKYRIVLELIYNV